MAPVLWEIQQHYTSFFEIHSPPAEYDSKPVYTAPPPPYPLERADVRRLRAIMKGISFEQSKHFRQRPFFSCLRDNSPHSTKCTCSIITCVKRNRDLEPLTQLFKRIGTQGLFHYHLLSFSYGTKFSQRYSIQRALELHLGLNYFST